MIRFAISCDRSTPSTLCALIGDLRLQRRLSRLLRVGSLRQRSHLLDERLYAVSATPPALLASSSATSLSLAFAAIVAGGATARLETWRLVVPVVLPPAAVADEIGLSA